MMRDWGIVVLAVRMAHSKHVNMPLLTVSLQRQLRSEGSHYGKTIVRERGVKNEEATDVQRIGKTLAVGGALAA